MSFEGFTVSYSGEELVCLSGDERLLVQDFTVESPQVAHMHARTHFTSHTDAVTTSPSSFSASVQSKCVLEVRQYSATCWPNPDSPIRNSFDLVNAVREHSRHSDASTVIHDP